MEEITDKDQLDDKIAKKLDPDFIERCTINKRNTITKKYEAFNSNSKSFIAPEWTLEYSLAKSPLAKLLWKSIHETRYQHPDSPANQVKFDEINNQITASGDILGSQLAYDIFKPLNDKNVSKAIVAQKLAIEIGKMKDSEKEELKQKVLESQYTEYLVDAIKHASQL